MKKPKVISVKPLPRQSGDDLPRIPDKLGNTPVEADPVEEYDEETEDQPLYGEGYGEEPKKELTGAALILGGAFALMGALAVNGNLYARLAAIAIGIGVAAIGVLASKLR
ncbi:MAG: hypothetical protein QW390_05155 [Candidatus Bathyarchaeia archaeon]